MDRPSSEFSPPRWLCNPHVQTLIASQWAKPAHPAFVHERFELDDGDFLDLAHAATGAAQGVGEQPSAGTDASASPVVCLFHGLAGSIDSAYVRGAFHALISRGMRVTLMHWRGCSGEPNRLARSYHSGASDDIGRVIGLLARRHPCAPLFAVGYSLGANALLKYLGETGEACPLAGAVAICPPLVLSVGADKLDTGITRGYQRHLLARLRSQHEAKRALRPELQLLPAPASLDTFWKFDDAVTAPLHGFAGVHDYYERCSARSYLPAIRRPTHLLYALDDPFFTPAVLPGRSELAPDTTLELAGHGGHVGFLGRRGDGDGISRRWLDRRMAEVVAKFAALER